MLLKWLLFLSNIFALSISYSLYSIIDKWTKINYDCIYTYLGPNYFDTLTNEHGSKFQQPKDELIPFCLPVEDFTFNERFCILNGGIIWKFEQLKKQNISNSDLVEWNAMVDIIDEYERYLQSDNHEISIFSFCNCTNRFYFGRHCQYTFGMTNESFDTILDSHFSNFEPISDEQVGLMNETDVTCYKRDPLCRSNCLDWRQICNGIIDCEDNQDEISCDLLEFNECYSDEYRCGSGHCIPLIFAFDKTFDCANGTDEQKEFLEYFEFSKCFKKMPNMLCDDYNDAWMKYPCGDGQSISNVFFECSNSRNSLDLKQVYMNDSTQCWQYLICISSMDYLFPLLVNCSALCGTNYNCLILVSSVCPEENVLFPSRSIMFSPSVYFVYEMNRFTYHVPNFICYTQCDHLFPPTSKQQGYSCRSIEELIDPWFGDGFGIARIMSSILRIFSGCTSKIRTNNSNDSIFSCPVEKRSLSYYRVNDGFNDCYFGLDENFNKSICIRNSTQQFQCWISSNECISRRFVGDFIPHCTDSSDEFYSSSCLYGTEKACDYQRGLDKLSSLAYDFQDLCNGREKQPSLFWFLNGTDETDCGDFWCLPLPSIRCNGHWECIDGRDELNCSLDSLNGLAKSGKLLHTLYHCEATEHFCLHVSNRSINLSRFCIVSSYAGDGHVDCWGASDERHDICRYKMAPDIHRYTYRCAGEMHKCIRVKQICNGHQDCPMGDDEKLCNWPPQELDGGLFYCRNGSIYDRDLVACNGKLDCVEGEDEWFCDLEINGPSLSNIYRIEWSTFPLNFQNLTTTRSIFHIQANTLSSTDTKSSWYCNRGMFIVDGASRRCLCSSSYTGERCEYQRDRISIILQIILPASFQRNNAIKFVLYLIDILSLNILAEEEILHFPLVHSSYKHLTSLASIRANNSFVRIDSYKVNMQQVINYQASWKFSIPFPFLPVRRLTTRLVFNDDKSSSRKCKPACHACVHGQCLSYQNSDDVLCLCYNGWTGLTCNESFFCAPGATSLSSNRCLCPMNRYGMRCFVRNEVDCKCQNRGTCIPLDARTGQSACLCSDNYFGTHCEQQHASLTIKIFDKDQPDTLPITLFQFVKMTSGKVINFQISYLTYLFEHISTRRSLTVYYIGYEELPLIVFCKIYYSSSIDDYKYYIVLQIPYQTIDNNILPKHVETQLETRQQCLHIRQMEVFKKPTNILAYPFIKRIKYYLRGCLDNTTVCFHDETYICLCPVRADQTPYCFIYDHTRELCKPPNYCLNEGLCIENRRDSIVEFTCLCPSCHYYGALCQFSVGQYGLSLDALVGMEMRTGTALSKQSILIKSCIAILSLMIILGSIGNFLCIITLTRKKSRKSGCGYYLLIISICNQLTLVLLGLRFVYFLVTQMVLWNNRTRSLILCQCLEYTLILLPNLSNWLSACVSIERTLTVVRGALFNHQTSIRIAKRLCIILAIVFAGLTVHEPLSRELIEDPRLGQYTWCIAQFKSVHWRTLASTLSIIHLLGPFFINLFSTGILMKAITRQKIHVRKDKNPQAFTNLLHQQIARYKHLIISPIVLLILALPRLIISLGSLCIDTTWRNYLFLAGYFISFIPFMTTLVIFIIPAPVYQDELKLCLSHIRRFFKIFN